MAEIGSNQYRCAACGGVFERGWTDDEAEAELQKNFLGCPTADCSVVCDDCFKRMPVDDWREDWKSGFWD